MTEGITWFGHDAFCFEGEVTVHIDPFKLPASAAAMKADIILITHAHYDHCSPEDVEKIQGPETVIVTTPDCADKLSGDVRTVGPGETLAVRGVEIEVVRSYNIDKKFHPKANNWVGYVFTLKGRRIYHAGDTDHIPEMREIDCDIALLPVSGTYVMTAEEAVEAALDIGPKVAIPMHYGGAVVGTVEDAERFAAGLEKAGSKVKAQILKQAQ